MMKRRAAGLLSIVCGSPPARCRLRFRGILVPAAVICLALVMHAR